MKKILVVDDDNDICLLLNRFLTKKGFEVQTANSGKEGLSKVPSFMPDLVMTDFQLGDLKGDELIKEIKAILPKIPILVITGYSDIKMAVNVMKMGAYDYIIKPLFPETILLTVTSALKDASSQEEADDTSAEGANSTIGLDKKTTKTSRLSYSAHRDYVRGKSSKACELYKQIDLVAPTNFRIIINGESGSGKEAIAKEIHERSTRHKMPFVAMDCGAISKELAGSELFGHEKGSFTGALHQKLGHFEMANGGTLFLDEVANLPYEVQVSLLRILQEQKMRRIGGTKEIELDVRIIVASNEDLLEASNKGKFREDLYYRFNEFMIQVPPLRERSDDLLEFAEFFLNKTNADLKKQVIGFSKEVIQEFRNYDWPGNLRELHNVIKRATLLTPDKELIALESLPETILRSSNTRIVPINGPSIKEVHREVVDENDSKKTTLKSVAHNAEYEQIAQTLKEANYNKSKAARLLNIDRKTLYNKMKQFGM